MRNFELWLLLESGRLDAVSINKIFLQQLDELLTRVHDPRRRASVEQMRRTNFVAYILTALRNAGFRDRLEREEAAADIISYLLVRPGNLFAGYEPNSSGPMPARWALSVRNAVANQRRDRRRRLANAGADAAAVALPPADDHGDEVLDHFRAFLGQVAGGAAVEVLNRRLEGWTVGQIAEQPAFAAGGVPLVRRLLGRVRAAASRYARQTTDADFRRQLARRLGWQVRECVGV